MLKKILAVFISTLFFFALASGCATQGNHLGQASLVTTATTFTAEPEPAPQPAAPEGVSALSGEESDAGESSAAEVTQQSNFDGGSVKVNVITASLTLDNKGKIKSLKLDKYEVSVEVDEKGFLVGDISTDGVVSAKERGYAYGMKESSKLSLEWFEQVENFERWARGQTVDELLAMKTTYIDEARPSVPNEPDLNISVSISVGDFLKAIRLAATDAGWTEAGVTVSSSEESSQDVNYSSFFGSDSSDSGSSGSSESAEASSGS